MRGEKEREGKWKWNGERGREDEGERKREKGEEEMKRKRDEKVGEKAWGRRKESENPIGTGRVAGSTRGWQHRRWITPEVGSHRWHRIVAVGRRPVL